MPFDSKEQWVLIPSKISRYGFTNSLISGSELLREAYRIDLEPEQKRLLEELRLVTSEEEAEQWVHRNGFPGYTPKSENTSPIVTEKLTNIIDAATCVRTMLNLSNALERATLDFDFEKLHSMLVKQESFLVLRFLDKVVTTDGYELKVDAHCKYMSEKELGISESKWKRIKKESLKELARATMSCALNTMLSGIEARVEWVQDENSNLKLVAAYAIKCPWHAVVVELVRQITHPNLSFAECFNPRCRQSLEGKRKGTNTCGKARCRKYYQRNKVIRGYA